MSNDVNNANAPPHAANTGNPNQQPQIGNVDITASFATLSIDDRLRDRGPETDVCIVHLKLLHAIHALKEDVGYTDGLFGLHDSAAIAVVNGLEQISSHVENARRRGETELLKLSLSKIREKRWALYVARAVDRYESWWKCMQTSTRLTEENMAEANSELYGTFVIPSMSSSAWKVDMLPPLDVLMVLHSHMLNPRAFLEDAMRASLRWLWQSGMPWHLIHAAIDTDFDYNVPEACQKRWTQATGRSWSNVDDSSIKIIDCPHCRVPNHIPWTTCNTNENSYGQDGLPSLVGSGYGDGRLNYECVACEATICKEALSVRKFVQDAALLLTRSAPMPGTILDPRSGMPEVVPSGDPALSARFSRTFPNRMIKLSLRIDIQEIFHAHKNPTMETVRDMIAAILEDSRRLRVINGVNTLVKAPYRLLPTAKICIRKMMSRYWENFSPFALDLCGAVMRQGVFIDKMVRLDWLHSPSTRQTMGRLIGKYFNFMTLMKRHPKRIAVPTLDVDLAWHTHQLSPPSYYSYTTSLTGKFIDHDDKIEETKLNEAFEWTSKTYQEEFHALYSECTCWYCEGE
ncbi:hypothetical protein E4U41_001509 [Claviceps citrina]|nr:hypothetical protein E4U41_001509 [Claviceps citrina]